MEPQEKMTSQQFVVNRLREIQKKAEAGNITEAVKDLKEVKSADTKNIYIIAIEKQLTKVSDKNVTEENKAEITKSLPSMFERAINDSQRRFAAVKPQEVKDTKEKEAALEKLKTQYFQRTDDYVAKGDYAHALEEIRRIYIIEPNSIVAKEYEKKIEQLTKIQEASDESQAVEKEKTPPVKETPPQPIKAEKPVPVKETTPSAKKSKIPLIAGAVAALLVVIAISIFVLSKKANQTPPPGTPVAAAQPTVSQPALIPAEVKGKDSNKTIEAEKAKQADIKKQEPKQVLPPVQQKQLPEQKQQAAPVQQLVQQPVQQPVQQQAPQQSEPVAAPRPFVAIENPPEVIKLSPPSYPEIAYRMGLNGKVVVEVTVDQQGKPIQASIVKSSSDIFNDASISAAMKSTYKPAMMSTGPVTAKVYVPFSFKLSR
jgi:protein TonB